MYQHNVTPTMTAAAIVATVLLSIGTYRYVETPLRSAKHGALKASCLIAVMAMCALGGCLAFLGLMPARRPPEEISSIIAATNEDVWSASRRSSWSQSPDGVLFRGDSPAFVLYVGDSNMAQYYPRVDKLLTDHPASSRSAIFAARDACVPGAVERFDSAQADRGPCREFLRSVAQHAASPQVEVVVIGASWYRYFRRYAGDRGPLRPQTKLLLHDLRQTLEGLVKAGKRVYLILNIPVNSKFDPHRMIQRTLKSPGFVSVIEMPTRADVVDDIDPVSAQLVHLAKTAGAIIIDPAQSFCDSQRCRVIAEDGRPIYRDLWHLRPSYVREYADFLDVTLLGESGNADPR